MTGRASRAETQSNRTGGLALVWPLVMIELLIYRCSTPFSVMHTAATVVVTHTAKGVPHDKRWAMEDAVYSSRPRFIRFRSE
jgi:hypothetical protein